MLAVRPVEHLNAQSRPFDQAGICNQGKFALDAPRTGLILASNLADVEGLVGRAVKERQKASSGLAEYEVSDG